MRSSRLICAATTWMPHEFGVTENPPKWHAVCTMEEYHSMARGFHLSLLLPLSCKFFVPRLKMAFANRDCFIHMMHGARACGHHIASGGMLWFRCQARILAKAEEVEIWMRESDYQSPAAGVCGNPGNVCLVFFFTRELQVPNVKTHALIMKPGSSRSSNQPPFERTLVLFMFQDQEP